MGSTSTKKQATAVSGFPRILEVNMLPVNSIVELQRHIMIHIRIFCTSKQFIESMTIINM